MAHETHPGTLSLGLAGCEHSPKFHGLRGNLDQAHRIPRLTRSPDLTLCGGVSQNVNYFPLVCWG